MGGGGSNVTTTYLLEERGGGVVCHPQFEDHVNGHSWPAMDMLIGPVEADCPFRQKWVLPAEVEGTLQICPSF